MAGKIGEKRARIVLKSCNVDGNAVLLLDGHAEDRFYQRRLRAADVHNFLTFIGVMERVYICNPKAPTREQIFFSDESESILFPSYHIELDGPLTDKIYQKLCNPSAVFFLATACCPNALYEKVFLKERIQFTPQVVKLKDESYLKGLTEGFKCNLKIKD